MPIGAGNDTITGDDEANELYGLGGNDTLYGLAEDDKLDGGIGNDILLGGLDDDELIGGDGIDTASYGFAGGQVFVDLGKQGVAQDTIADGKDTLFGIENLAGSAYADGLSGDGLANKIEGGGGDDKVEGGGGNDVLIGGANDGFGDTVAYTNAGSGVTVNLALTSAQDTKGAGKDTISQFENLTGSDFNDTLTGDAKNNTFDGGTGDDILIGGLGSDILYGNSEDAFGDTASFAGITTAVTAVLSAGDGTATYKNGKADDSDTLLDIENLTGGSAADQLTGDNSVNRLDGGAGNDTLDGGAGNDILNGGKGADTLDGGDDSDTVSYSSSTVAVTVVMDGVTASKGGDAVGDILISIENLIGSAKNDKPTGNASKNTIDGGDGADIIEGRGEADRLFGSFGIDTLSYALSLIGVLIFLVEQGTFDGNGDAIDGNAQSGGDAQGDLIWGFENVTGSAEADAIGGDNFANVVLGGAGDDLIGGLGGKDTLDGGTGIDTLDYGYLGTGENVTATLGSLNTKTGAVAKTSTSGVVGDIDTVTNFENITGGEGNDILTGNAGDNTLDGGAGDDQLYGMAGADTLTGGDGDDVIEGGEGADKLDGGANIVFNNMKRDTVAYTQSNAAVTIDLNLQGTAGAAAGGHATGDELTGFENVVGSKFDDTLAGDDDNNIIEGGAGNDVLDGRADEGGGGSDTISFASATVGITFSLAAQDPVIAQKTGGAGNDIAVNFESIIGGKGNDFLTGDNGANVIDGGAGNDVIEGSGSLDLMIGGLGIDTLSYATSGSGVTVDLAKQGTSDADGKPLTQGIGMGTGGDAISDAGWGFENLIGSASFDQLFGDDFANTILGGDDGDYLTGRGGNDILDGGAGVFNIVFYTYLTNTQHITVTLGAATASLGTAKTTTSGVAGDKDTIQNFYGVYGGAGNDVLTGNSITNELNGDSGNDRLFGLGDGDQLDGGGGNDYLDGGISNDQLKGSAGDDFLIGGVGSGTTLGDWLDGGADNDTASYQTSALGVTVNLLADTAEGGDANNDELDNIENLIGSAKIDILTGDDKDNVIEGGLGDDVLSGEGSDGPGDWLSYANATAVVTVSLTLQGGQQSTGGGGNDNASGFENLLGGKGNDKLTGDVATNIIDGGAGNDIIVGGGGSDTLFGGEGNDTLTSDGDDTLEGGAGNDILNGVGGTNTFIGGAGADKITGNATVGDLIKISGSDGVGDIIDAGASVGDTLQFYGASPITLSIFKAAASGIEHINAAGAGILGTTGADVIDFSGVTTNELLGTIDGLGGNDTITGSDYDDVMHGGIGNDILNGGLGADTLVGGAGADTLNGGDEDDIFLMAGADAVGDKINGGAGSDTLDFEDGGGPAFIGSFNATTASIEFLYGTGTGNISGTAAGDVIDLSGLLGIADIDDGINGAGGNDVITGSKFSDFLLGGAGNDALTGGDDDDDLFGDAGNDTLNGGNGGDLLVGGLGADTLTGGADADTFHIKWGEGVDKITDFSSVDDTIELHLSSAGIAAPISLVQGSGAGLPAYAGLNPALIYDQDDGKLYYDPGAGNAVQIAILTDKATIGFSDFTFT